MFTPLRALKSLTVLALLILSLVGLMPASGQSNPVATLDPVQGLVQVRPAAAAINDWQTITGAVAVSEGDTIRTDSLGLAYLTFFEGVESDILPNTQITVGKFEVSDTTETTYQITLQIAVGDVHNQIDQVLNAGSHYEIYTPAAAITVRGTNFFSSAHPDGKAGVDTLEGLVQVFGIDNNGKLTNPVGVGVNQSLEIDSQGNPGQPGPLEETPPYPPSSPLAPATCGNAICEAGEESTCALDCQTFPSCGDKICQTDLGEGPVTCAVDCVPSFRTFPPIEDTVIANVQTGQQCQVQTDQRNINVRVGPGYNRGIYDFMTPNQLFSVIGENQASDGSKWWQIEYPGTAQAWVDQLDVTATGDCANIGESAAPPIVFAQPTAAPTAAPGQPTATPSAMSISFYADAYAVYPGQCTTIHWDVEGIKQVYYQDKGVTGHESRKECIRVETTFTLKVITLDNQTITKTVTIKVDPYLG
jgi:hypothetical protein